MNKRAVRRLFKAAVGALLLTTATLLGQTPATPQVPYENLKADVQGLRVTITYDLLSADPNDMLKVSLEVRIKGTGQLVTVSPGSLTGDVGANLAAGKQKKIIWNAGLDVETPQFELYDYALVVVAGPPTGQLSVDTDPQGAAVAIDGETRGMTPLTIEGLKPGPHRVLVSKAGYLPNSREVLVEVGKTTPVKVALTQPGGTQRPGAPPAVVPPKSGGVPKWIYPIAGAGAVAAALGLKGKKTVTPATCTFTLTPPSFSPGPQQGGGSVDVTVGASPTGCSPQAWTATVDAGSTNFVHLSTGSGTAGQSVRVTVDANPPADGNPSRTGSATIAGKSFQIAAQTNAIAVSGNVEASEQSGSATFPMFAGVTVVAGQKLTITASGSIQVPGIGPVGANGGGNGTAGAQARLPNAPKYGLICGIGSDQTKDLYFMGPPSLFATGTPAPQGGLLFCGMNAPDVAGFTGNTGSWQVTVTVGG
jgi:hypothetical protein